MAAAKKRGLGRGLGALMGGLETEEVTIEQDEQAKEEPKAETTKTGKSNKSKTEPVNLSGVQEIDINLLSPDKSQPRKNFDEEALSELAESIKEFGVIQPLLVQKKEDYYQIIAGERRFRAAMKAGLKKLPALIKEYNPQETLEVSLIENIQRENLDPIEEAQAYQRLSEEYKLTQEEIAGKVGKSRPVVANALRLLNLDPQVRNMVAEGRLSTGHAKVLLGVENKELGLMLASKCAADGWSVRQLEKAVEAARKVSAEPETNKKEDPLKRAEALAIARVEEEMQKLFGTKVQIIAGKKKGKIEIEYYSEDELERVLALLRSLGA
ncbi:MAG: ParB/RepB/Spo0J family partition protein [Lachnospiraceae bacterium]|nr:ParB/RepB/Spo0J family partition protein [Lachnospiraceae bacterium]